MASQRLGAPNMDLTGYGPYAASALIDQQVDGFAAWR